jgi:hypothetical protein
MKKGKSILKLAFFKVNHFSKTNDWNQVLIELRNDVKPDEKSKAKQFVINRLIEEYSTVFSKFMIINKKKNFFNNF